MQEEYLHYLWRTKRLDFRQLQLKNKPKSTLEIIEIGWYNTDAGPDFFNGTVKIDGIQWSGNIEMHIKSSDWYAHGHQHDAAYNNVILHVVYEHDKEVLVNGQALPTVELKQFIDQEHLINYQAIISKREEIPCSNEVQYHRLALLQQIDLSLMHRIERKGLALFDEVNEEKRNQKELFQRAILKAIGGRLNAFPMLELAKQLPYQIIEKEKWDSSRIEAMVFGVAGLLQEPKGEMDSYFEQLKYDWMFLKRKHSLREMNPITWKFSGVRPFSFPALLLAQWSAFIQQFDERIVQDLSATQLIKKVNDLNNELIHPYWSTHFVFGKESKERKVTFSKQFKQNLIINGIVPYLVALKHITNDFSYVDKAVEILEFLPAEKNNITKQWANSGIKAENAMESQGLIELYNEFCTFRKCLTCKVGVSILENKHEKNNTKNSILL